VVRGATRPSAPARHSQLVRLGSRDRGLGPHECRLRAQLGGPSPIDRPSGNSVGSLGFWLLVQGPSEYLAGVIHGALVLVSSVLGQVQRLLVGVPAQLIAVESALAVVGGARGRLALGGVVAAARVQRRLLLIDARLVAVCQKLLTISKRLLQASDALLLPDIAHAACVVV